MLNLKWLKYSSDIISQNKKVGVGLFSSFFFFFFFSYHLFCFLFHLFFFLLFSFIFSFRLSLVGLFSSFFFFFFFAQHHQGSKFYSFFICSSSWLLSSGLSLQGCKMAAAAPAPAFTQSCLWTLSQEEEKLSPFEEGGVHFQKPLTNLPWQLTDQNCVMSQFLNHSSSLEKEIIMTNLDQSQFTSWGSWLSGIWIKSGFH